MSKKILAMFMATAMAATTFFGCGSTEETSKKDEGSSTTSTDEDSYSGSGTVKSENSRGQRV